MLREPLHQAPRGTVVLTRPAGQGLALRAACEAAGWAVLPIPAIAIELCIDEATRRAALARLGQFDLVHFASANAIAGLLRTADHSVANLRPGAVIAVMGPGSREALNAVWPEPGALVVTPGSERTDAPEALDTETLLATLDQLRPQGWTDARALLVKGEHGRAALAQALQARGLEVQTLTVYRRMQPVLSDPHADALHQAALRAPPCIVFSSSEGAAKFATMLDGPVGQRYGLHDHWRDWPVLATHARVAQAARDLSCKKVRAVPPYDQAVLSALDRELT